MAIYLTKQDDGAAGVDQPGKVNQRRCMTVRTRNAAI
jgi:hypothetical protein